MSASDYWIPENKSRTYLNFGAAISEVCKHSHFLLHIQNHFYIENFLFSFDHILGGDWCFDWSYYDFEDWPYIWLWSKLESCHGFRTGFIDHNQICLFSSFASHFIMILIWYLNFCLDSISICKFSFVYNEPCIPHELVLYGILILKHAAVICYANLWKVLYKYVKFLVHSDPCISLHRLCKVNLAYLMSVEFVILIHKILICCAKLW